MDKIRDISIWQGDGFRSLQIGAVRFSQDHCEINMANSTAPLVGSHCQKFLPGLQTEGIQILGSTVLAGAGRRRTLPGI